MGDLIQLDEHRPHVLIQGAKFGKRVHVVPLHTVIAWLKGQCEIEFGDPEAVLREYVAALLVDEGAVSEADITRYARLFKFRQRYVSKARCDVTSPR